MVFGLTCASHLACCRRAEETYLGVRPAELTTPAMVTDAAALAFGPVLPRTLDEEFREFDDGFRKETKEFDRTAGASLVDFIQERRADNSLLPTDNDTPFGKGVQGQVYKYVNPRNGSKLVLKTMNDVQLERRIAKSETHWAHQAWGEVLKSWNARPVNHVIETDEYTNEAIITSLLKRDVGFSSLSIDLLDTGLCQNNSELTGMTWMKYCGFEYCGISGTNLKDLGDAFGKAIVESTSGASVASGELRFQWILLRGLMLKLLPAMKYLQDRFDFVHGDAKLKNIFIAGICMGLQGAAHDVRSRAVSECVQEHKSGLTIHLADYGKCAMTYENARFSVIPQKKHAIRMETLHAAASKGLDLFCSPQTAAGIQYFTVNSQKVEGVPLFWCMMRNTTLPMWKQLDIYTIILGCYVHAIFYPMLARYVPELFASLWVDEMDAQKAEQITTAIRDQVMPESLAGTLGKLESPHSINILIPYVLCNLRFRTDVIDVVVSAFKSSA